MSPSPPASGVTFYVSPQGRDTSTGASATPGKANGPFATPQRARDAVRALKSSGKLHGPVTVYFRGGRYELSKPLTFTPDDSATADAPITWAAYRKETPVFSGGRVLSGWKHGDGPLWTVTLPDVKTGRLAFHELFVDGLRRTRARFPNAGFLTTEGMVTTGDPARFTYRNVDLKPEWADAGVEVVSYAKWAGFRMPLRAVDPATHTATLSRKVFEHIREENQRYFLENVPGGVDSPGEWRLDKATGVLTYYPMPYEEMASAQVIAPALTQLVRLEGDPANGRPVSHLRFKGITFAHTDWAMAPEGYVDDQAAADIPAAFSANGAEECALEQCRFIHLGQYAVEFIERCKRNRIVGCELADLGAGGVKIGEMRVRPAEERTSHNVITDNHIHDLGHTYPTGIGVWIGQSSDNRVAHNHIHDTYYSAISVGWTWGYGPSGAGGNLIEYNDCHDLGRGLLSDMGGIYTLGAQPGTIIRNNVFHDINSYDYGGWGIYPDEGSAGLLIENNLVYNTKSGGFHQHYGRDNVVRNNIFALAWGKQGQLIRTRREDHLSFTMEGNIVYWKDGPLLGSNWEGDDTFKLDRNLYWKVGAQPVEPAGMSLDAWRERGHDTHSVVADPLFRDPDHGDFRLKPGSPAEKIGFRPFDVSKVGPRKSVLRPPDPETKP